jgi:ribonuclease PH
MTLALGKVREQGLIRTVPINDYIAATSVGIVAGMPMLDLAYEEDSKADVDMNIVKTGDGRYVEVQGTAESEPFDRGALDGLLSLADHGIEQLFATQRAIVGKILGR